MPRLGSEYRPIITNSSGEFEDRVVQLCKNFSCHSPSGTAQKPRAEHTLETEETHQGSLELASRHAFTPKNPQHREKPQTPASAHRSCIPCTEKGRSESSWSCKLFNASASLRWPWVKIQIVPSEHPNPHSNRLKWVVNSPTPKCDPIGFDPQQDQDNMFVLPLNTKQNMGLITPE